MVHAVVPNCAHGKHKSHYILIINNGWISFIQKKFAASRDQQLELSLETLARTVFNKF